MATAVTRESSRRRAFAATIDATLVLRLGLAVLFGANALVAWFDPEQFTSLVAEAGVDRLVDSQVILWGIRLNDFVVAFAILVLWNRWPRLIPAWVGLYTPSVGVIKVAALV
jgi:hypothetical protein